jgi:hypothetical protein
MSGGGDGATDIFVFCKVTDSGLGRTRDVIQDFQSGIDLIDVSEIDARPSLAGDQAFAFSAGAQAHSVWAVASKGNMTLRGDTTGDLKADFEILFLNVGALSASDVIL